MLANGLAFAPFANYLCVSGPGSEGGTCDQPLRAAIWASYANVLQVPAVDALVIGGGGVTAQEGVGEGWHRPPHGWASHEEGLSR